MMDLDRTYTTSLRIALDAMTIARDCYETTEHECNDEISDIINSIYNLELEASKDIIDACSSESFE